MTNAGGFPIHCICQFFNRFIAIIPCLMSEMPILAVKAVKRTGMGKNSEVLISGFRAVLVSEERITTSGSSGADPISHTIGGQGIVVP